MSRHHNIANGLDVHGHSADPASSDGTVPAFGDAASSGAVSEGAAPTELPRTFGGKDGR